MSLSHEEVMVVLLQTIRKMPHVAMKQLLDGATTLEITNEQILKAMMILELRGLIHYDQGWVAVVPESGSPLAALFELLDTNFPGKKPRVDPTLN